MKAIKLFKVDAFATELFRGNSAAVCILDDWLDDALLLDIAIENAIAETAFILKKNDSFHLRWFTPEIEIDLCGHATLASAHILFSQGYTKSHEVHFESQSGNLFVQELEQGKYKMNFPSRNPKKAELPKIIRESLNIQPIAVYKDRDYILLYEHENDIKSLAPNQKIMDQINLDPGGVCVTAKGVEVDFVSRYFTPQASIFEDPVTGSSFSSLIPFWASRLNKSSLIAKQISDREGTLYCNDMLDRVEISGYAKTFFEGQIFLNP